MKKNIIITGATSFIGLHLIDGLIEHGGYNIYAIVRENSNKINRLPKSKITVIENSMENFELLEDKIPQNFYALFHLAWNGTHGEDRMNPKMQKDNYLNSLKLLEVSKKKNCNIFITAGSQAEYGPHNDKVYETTKEIPNTEYGKYKLKFYNDAKTFCENNGICLIEPRFFSLYGINDYENTLIINSIKKMQNNQSMDFTKGVQLWNYLYIEDAVNALILLMEKEVSGIYNFGSLDTRPLKEFVLEIKRILNSTSNLNFGKIQDSGIINVNPSIEKLLNTIEWKPQTTFTEGIRMILRK